jgi:hypothetical protein
MRVIYLLSALLWLFFCAPAFAQGACAPRDALVKGLADKFQEHVSASGLDSNGNLLEIFSSESGTWTVLVTTPAGITCFITSGEDWRQSRLGGKA